MPLLSFPCCAALKARERAPRRPTIMDPNLTEMMIEQTLLMLLPSSIGAHYE